MRFSSRRKSLAACQGSQLKETNIAKPLCWLHHCQQRSSFPITVWFSVGEDFYHLIRFFLSKNCGQLLTILYFPSASLGTCQLPWQIMLGDILEYPFLIQPEKNIMQRENLKAVWYALRGSFGESPPYRETSCVCWSAFPANKCNHRVFWTMFDT